MQAKDVMTANVITVRPDTTVEEIARLLLERHISAVPVVDAQGAVLGVVSEGDLLRRPELASERRQPWWLRLVGNAAERAEEYLKTHGLHAEDVMTHPVVTVTEETPLGRIAELLEKRRIKRVPVVRDGRLVGIVSRANLLHALAARKDEPAEPSTDDRALREAVTGELEQLDWATHGALNVIVTGGVVELWGWVESAEERKALIAAAEGVPGVRAVEDHLGSVPPWARGT